MARRRVQVLRQGGKRLRRIAAETGISPWMRQARWFAAAFSRRSRSSLRFAAGLEAGGHAQDDGGPGRAERSSVQLGFPASWRDSA